MTEEELYIAVIEKEGKEEQIRQLQEECSELAVALSHFCRGRENAIDEVIEELVDVEILLDQMKQNVFTYKGQRKRIKHMKLARLAERVGETYEAE
jgi:hypothetical protein